MTLSLEAWEIVIICLYQCLLKTLDLLLQSFNVLEIFVMLSDLVAELIVDLSFLVVNDVRMLLIKKDPRLLGGEERHGCLSALLSRYYTDGLLIGMFG